jgi:hypothetical protein
VATVVVNSGQLQQLINRDVLAQMLVVGEQVKVVAQRKVGKDTLNLHNRIVKRFFVSGRNVVVRVGSVDVPYAIHHHEGTEAHVIVPRRARALRFVVAGRTVFAKRVMHPGTKPNRYLTEALDEVIKRRF